MLRQLLESMLNEICAMSSSGWLSGECELALRRFLAIHAKAAAAAPRSQNALVFIKVYSYLQQHPNSAGAIILQ
jgi:hypothetical protein